MLSSWLPKFVRRLSSPTQSGQGKATCPKTDRFRPRLETLEDRTLPSTVNWIGGSGDWNDASHWLDATTLTNHIPGAGDDAVINVAGITVTHSTGADSVSSLTSSEALILSGGSLSLASSSAINSTFVESGGTLAGDGDVLVSGTLTWTGGFMSGAGHTQANGGLDVPIGNHGLEGRPLDIGGGATLIGTIYAGNGAVITNVAGSTFDFQDGVIADQGGAASSLINQGTLQKSGTFYSSIDIALYNSGTVSVQTGTLILTGGFSNFSGATLTGGTYFVSGNFRFTDANIQTDAANITLSGTGVITDQSGSNALTGLASVSPGGSLVLQNSSLSTTGNLQSAGAVAIDATSMLTVGGTYTQTGGSTTLSGGTLATSSLVDIQAGTLAGTGTINANVQNAGLLMIGNTTTVGILIINGNYTQTPAGTLTVKVGGFATAGADFDQLVLTDGHQATLDGTLNVTLINGYTPTSGDSVMVMTFDSETGTFTALTGDGSLYTPNYDPTDVTLVAN